MLQTTWRCVLSMAEYDSIHTISQDTFKHQCTSISWRVQMQQQLHIMYLL